MPAVPARTPQQRTGGSAQRRRAVRAAAPRPGARPPRDSGRPAARGAQSRGGARVADLTGRLARRGALPRPGRRTALVAAVLAALLAALAWVAFGSPWLRVEQVRVVGASRTAPERATALVGELRGEALASVDTAEVARRVAGGLPLVASVDVERAWPSTLLVRLHERRAVAAVPSTTGGVDLVDADARVLQHAGAAPAGVPLLSVDVERSRPGTLRAALAVNGALPDDVRSRVASITAQSPDSVVLQLTDGPSVVWGDAGRPERKAQVLLRLLADPAASTAAAIDVSAPDAPAVRPAA
ncbi:FtsQ-type POTRA domain-containing protein [Kineococcus sp. TRM81007]|uniref:cell division protein FtsQ/DivIB n=1 Tax=Kineococcus sp. TRM81007 TaxID=2925831 RepID=UPI001F59C140|nr:FtsQ-type POTRA domain-containing protein [Kineococcus sp. TRM81007]MCI2239707.1 FtsQ-type POTRA domain-containing protein [Kineococcus sp. TRM81007]